MKKVINNKNKGFTLVEVIVSVAILAMVCVTFAVIITGTTGIYRRSADLSNQGSEAGAIMESLGLEGVTPTSETQGTVSFGDGETINVQGTYKTVEVDDVTFKVFVPQEENSD